MLTDTAPLTIGESQAGQNFFYGLIDEVQIFNFALPSADIAALLGIPSVGPSTDQRGYARVAGAHIDIGATEYQSDLTISGSGLAYVGANNMINDQFTLTNNGPGPVVGATLTDVLPSTVTFQSLTAPAGWTLSQPAVGATGTIMATDTDSLAAGASATFRLVVQAKSSTRTQVISNTASAGPTTFDPNTSNNSVTLTTTVPGSRPVDVDIHGQPADGVIGQPIGGPITVAIVDANGNRIPTGNELVTLAIATGPSGATLGGTTTVPAVNGVATFTDLTLSLAGIYTLTATGGTLTPDFSNSFTISPIDVTKDLKVELTGAGNQHRMNKSELVKALAALQGL